MKTKELIKILEKLPKECTIKHLDCEWGTSEPVVEYLPEKQIYWITEGQHIEGEDIWTEKINENKVKNMC